MTKAKAKVRDEVRNGWLYCNLPEPQHDHLNKVLLGVTFILAVPVALFTVPYIAAAVLLFLGS